MTVSDLGTACVPPSAASSSASALPATSSTCAARASFAAEITSAVLHRVLSRSKVTSRTGTRAFGASPPAEIPKESRTVARLARRPWPGDEDPANAAAAVGPMAGGGILFIADTKDTEAQAQPAGAESREARARARAGRQAGGGDRMLMCWLGL